MPETTPTAYTLWSLGLTPAQSWIAEARRSRDLLAGSRLLAWLMSRLLLHLKGQGATVRLPVVNDEALQSLSGKLIDALRSGSTAVTNHASGWIGKPLEETEGLFDGLQAFLDRAWNEVQTEVASAAKKSARDLWDLAGPAIGQPACPLQLVWALKEGPDEEAAKRLDGVEAAYAAVKRSRPVVAHVGGAPVRKCGQCGKRESMGGADPATWRKFQDDLAELPEVKQGLRFDAAEFLCSVCALRRLAGYLQEEAFPSTSAIAASDWLWRIRQVPDLRAALSALDAATRRVPGYEKEWADRAPLYYRRSLERELRQAREAGDLLAEDRFGDVQSALGDLEARISRHDGTEPIPAKPTDYLAVVMFDGDDLGRKLREELDRLPRKVADFQDELVALFADPDETNEPRGRPFYLGGDEGLVLVPLAAVLDVAQRVKTTWDRTAGSTEAKVTLSMGIALFDRERPLGAAIETARRSLEAAKRMERPRKDALAVSVQTASGSEWTAVAHWGESWERITEAVNLIREGTLASGWPYDVERFLRTLPEDAFQSDSPTREAIREEVKRISYRRASRKSEREGIWTRLQGEALWQEQPSVEEIASLPDHLHLVAFLARHSPRLPPSSPSVGEEGRGGEGSGGEGL